MQLDNSTPEGYDELIEFYRLRDAMRWNSFQIRRAIRVFIPDWTFEQNIVLRRIAKDMNAKNAKSRDLSEIIQQSLIAIDACISNPLAYPKDILAAIKEKRELLNLSNVPQDDNAESTADKIRAFLGAAAKTIGAGPMPDTTNTNNDDTNNDTNDEEVNEQTDRPIEESTKNTDEDTPGGDQSESNGEIEATERPSEGEIKAIDAQLASFAKDKATQQMIDKAKRLKKKLEDMEQDN